MTPWKRLLDPRSAIPAIPRRAALRTAVLALALLLSLRPSEAAAASGSFTSKDEVVAIRGGYAFPAGTGAAGTAPGLLLALSSSGFEAAIVDGYWDRKLAIDRFFVDDETRVVYVHLGADGSYRGISYTFGPGNGCAFCSDPATKAALKVAGGRLSGKLSIDGDPSFAVEVDLPVATNDHGTVVEGGGEPGRAYLAYHAALVARDGAAVKASFTREDLSHFAASGSVSPEQMAHLAEGQPEAPRVAKAFARGDEALVLVEGRGASGKVRGEVVLVKEDGSWRVADAFYAEGDWPPLLRP